MLDPIYMDAAAGTALDPKALEAMMPWLGKAANPHARHHIHGAAAARAVETARVQIADAIKAKAADITFTAGTTEANNLVIFGLADTLRKTGKTHIITSAVEHASILEPLKALDGFTVSVLTTKPCGMIEADMIEAALTPETGLVCVQAVNNETGTIQPLAEIAAMLKNRDIFFHCDAAQALGKIDFDVTQLDIDFASFSAHKAHGPQGIGALYIKSGHADKIAARQHGGGQEKALRSGTVPVALCVGFGVAATLLDQDTDRLWTLRQRFLKQITPLAPILYEHTDPNWQVPGILSVRFKGIDHETLVMALPELSFGTGSACSSAGNKYSHVITAIAGQDAAAETIRLSFSRMVTETEINKAAEMILTAIKDIKQAQEAA